ncbi:lung seven transmembrane receptor family protein SCDLUD_004198 [Saccharomycodes ludwigii]|uniref:lung seven transmembrane receptor family protein n=1 Tax=Saccharomycodes ludwigii TaxID=36035 RepID=UPI001E82A770|nr:hypothetical protein SCDLUD_004198 [Saccharomycodes ludwigii]KAH3899895.1 hypothetical protein SCDLUD_004198 [Saccharomycodes ludwigii]
MNNFIKPLFATLLLLLSVARLPALVQADKKTLNQNNGEVCSGMYSKEDWGGKVDPFISFNLQKTSNDDEDISVIIFDYEDYLHIGKEIPGTNGELKYICDDYAVDLGLCDSDDKGNFLIEEAPVYNPDTDENTTLSAEIYTFHQSKTGLHEVKYQVKKTGYYCVDTFSADGDDNLKYSSVVNFRNAFGHLPASEINKLPLYGILAVAYAVAMFLYLFAFWKHRHELLPLQKYLLGFFVFLTAETIFVWAYYDIRNETGNGAGAKAYMVFLSLFSAGKISFSFFLVLIIALGYGVVFPKLNKKLMLRCQLFTIFTYAWIFAYLIQNYLTPSDDTSLKPLITFFPACFCLFVFYLTIIKSLSSTLAFLNEQKQVVKLQMYKKLLNIIVFSLVIILIFLVITSFVVFGMSSTQLVEQHWKTRFFFVDFWPSIIYFIVFVSIAFIWRPTSTSYMLACSQQLPTDPENIADFDLDDLHSLEQEFNDIDDDANVVEDDLDDNPFRDPVDDENVHNVGNKRDDESKK